MYIANELIVAHCYIAKLLMVLINSLTIQQFEFMKRHLAIFYPEVIKQIFSGKKKIESRFSKAKIAPFGQVKVGDLVYMKAPGKDITGQFWVEKVISFEGMDSGDWQKLRQQYGDDSWLPEKNGAKYGTLIFIGRVDQLITAPFRLEKKDQRGWVVLD